MPSMDSTVTDIINWTSSLTMTQHPGLIQNNSYRLPTVSDGFTNVKNVTGRSGIPPHHADRVWGYMTLENVRPVYSDQRVSLERFTLPLYGCVMPVLAILTLATNSLVCAVLLQPGMRGPTGCLLVATALSEIGMALWPLPPYFYFYTLGNYREWLPFNWCYVSLWLLEFLPTICHASAIWLTVAVAAQRYIAICHPMKAQRWCISNTPGAIQIAVIIFLLAIGTHISRFFESEFHPTELKSRIQNEISVIGCASDYVPFVNTFTDVYFKVYFCFKTLVIHVIPCVIVLVMTAFLLRSLLVAKVWRKKSSSLSRRSRITRHWVQLSEVKYGTCMLVVLFTVFLVVELPLSMLYSLELLHNRMLFEFDLIGSDKIVAAIIFGNMTAVVLGPVKFLIFCAMSKRFRKKLKFICTAASRMSCGKKELPAW